MPQKAKFFLGHFVKEYNIHRYKKKIIRMYREAFFNDLNSQLLLDDVHV